MTEAKRKITKFDFESKGAHCALVDAAANQQTALVMKSTKASEEEIQKAVEVNMKMTLLEFLTRYIGLWIDEAEVIAGMMGMSYDDLYDEDEMSSFEEIVQANLDKVQVSKSKESEKFEGAFKDFIEKYHSKTSSSVEDGESSGKSTEDKKSTKEVNKTMTDKTEVTQESLEEQINKAAEAIVASRLEDIEKAANAKVEAVSQELEIFKAREDAREKQEYLAKAEGYAQYLGEDADKEAIAKSLSFIEKSEDAKAAAELLKSLKDALDKESGFEEIGKSATEDQPTDDEAKVEELKKSFEADGMTPARAYTKAYEQIHSL